mmetsp:Transcript_514/g.557  ORF Transcript_514/g.557 Transcript_514/m.557 type:complete len:331 (-) Transcript_514:2-994(-)
MMSNNGQNKAPLHNVVSERTSITANTTTSFITALIAGGLAGTSVDIALFPIDTLKTRMQSPQGFIKAGGFRGVYNGLGAAAIGSAPGAALFFCSYETWKPIVRKWQQSLGENNDGRDSDRESGIHNPAISHMIAASAGEMAACLVRVPTEVIKAKMQTNTTNALSLSKTFKLVLSEKSTRSAIVPNQIQQFTGGLYRGYGMTLMREIPFAMIQFPIYEALKKYWTNEYRNGVPVNPVQAAACGSLGGAIAAAITTPLDVIKTRLMLGADKNGKLYNKGAIDVVRRTYAETHSMNIFFRGIQPRVMWITIGGFVFFGAYEGFKTILSPILD